MKFLIDAQLPYRLKVQLQNQGHDVKHTLDLPEGNRTTDTELNQISVLDQRILISKDADFVNSFMILEQPFKLLLIATGNIKNTDLLKLFDDHMPMLLSAFTTSKFVELNVDGLIVHS